MAHFCALCVTAWRSASAPQSPTRRRSCASPCAPSPASDLSKIGPLPFRGERSEVILASGILRPVIAGLDPAIHHLRKNVLQRRWTRGSGPRVHGEHKHSRVHSRPVAYLLRSSQK
jgi:hypothetical protein